MALAFLEQQINDVDVQFQRLWQRDTIWRRSACSRLADSQCDALSDGDNLRDWRLAIQHGYRLAISDRAEVLAEAGLQLRYANGLHSSIMTRTGHDATARSRS